MNVLIGVGPHKATNAVAALNDHGEYSRALTLLRIEQASGRWSAGRNGSPSASGQ
jgi:hypothetical protein